MKLESDSGEEERDAPVTGLWVTLALVLQGAPTRCTGATRGSGTPKTPGALAPVETKAVAPGRIEVENSREERPVRAKVRSMR